MQVELLAKELITKLRHGKEVDNIFEQLSSLKFSDLIRQLKDDQIKKAFWINLYNSISLFLLKDDPCIITMQVGRKQFFRSKIITIAGKNFSLNFILHHILRKSKKFWINRLISNMVTPGFEKILRLEKTDPKIYFALNCGATSCPPLRIYEKEKIDKQLELATISFLDSKTQYFPEENIVTVSQIFNWYISDFGNEKGVLEMLKKYQKIPDDSIPMIIYNVFNWNPSVNL